MRPSITASNDEGLVNDAFEAGSLPSSQDLPCREDPTDLRGEGGAGLKEARTSGRGD
jgi:hypothetical protein